jgi:hypothetical protein
MQRIAKLMQKKIILGLSANFVDKEYQSCVSVTVGPKGIKKNDSYHNKKRQPKAWIKNLKKPNKGTSKNQTKEIKVSKVVY